MMKFPRRSFVTHKRFQYGFILCLGIFGGLLGLLNSWIQVYIAQQNPDKTGLISIVVIVGVLLIVCAPVVIVALIFTNRVVGPLLRLQRHMESAAKGETSSNFKFRDKDVFRDLEEPYNQILERLRNAEKK
jgi:nitrogen fixation/metabolism regulation signal transduction histidine kinase